MKPIAAPISRWALRMLATKGMESRDAQIGLRFVPDSDIESFEDQGTAFLEGYASCLSDLLYLTTDGEDPLDQKTLRAILHTWLYLCSNAITKRFRATAKA